MRSVTVLAILVFCMAGILMAHTQPSLAVRPAGYDAPSAAYHPQVSPDITVLQAQERAALASGDLDAARELEKQVQAILIRQQDAVPQSAPVVVVGPPCLAERFADDQLIHPGPITASSAAWEMDGTVWTAFASGTDSFIWVYKSTNHGQSWDGLLGFCWPPLHKVSKIEMVVDQDDSGFIYVFENVPDAHGNLAVTRMHKDGTGLSGWRMRPGSDTVTDFAACRDFSSSYWLYATAHNGLQGGNTPRSYILRSTDYGITWVVTDTVYNLARPRLVFGPGQCGYLSAVPQPDTFKGQVLTGVTTAWSSPGTWRFVGWRPDTFAINDAGIAPAFTAPVESAVVWIAYTQDNNRAEDRDVYSAYATDTLLGWVGPAAVANTVHTEGYVDLKNYTSAGNDYVNLSYVDIGPASHDNAWLGYSSSGAPSTWNALSDPWVNKSGYVGWGMTTFPRIVYSPGAPGPGGGLVFVGQDGNGYFNAPWSTGVAEDRAKPEQPGTGFSVLPSVSRGPVRVSWNGKATRLTVTDVTGSIVRSVAAPAGNSFVWDGRAPAGTYIMYLTTTSGTATRPVVIQ